MGGGCFAGLLVEGPWCNPWISGEPNHLENNFPGSSERNRKRTTPSEILNDAIDEKNPPLVCRIPSTVSIVWWLLCSSAKVYIYISHLPWICSRKFGNSSKNTSYQMMIKHGDQIHKRIPKNSTLRQKTRHQGTEQGGNIASNTTPKKLLDHWSKMRRVPPELSDTTIHFFHSFLLTFWKPFHDVPCVKGFQNGMLFITSPPERVEMFNIPPIPHELPCFSSFLPTNPNWLVTHQLHRRFVSHQTIGAHARQCATALGAGSWGWSFFFVFFCVQIIKAGRWFFIVSTSFTHVFFVILFFFEEILRGNFPDSICGIHHKLPHEELEPLAEKPKCLVSSNESYSTGPVSNFLWEILIESCQ